MIGPNAIVRVPEHVAHRPFERETVVVNLRSGTYHGLNPTGGRLFELLTEHGEVAAVAAAAAAEYGEPLDEMTRHVVRLCEELAERGLIEVVGEEAG